MKPYSVKDMIEAYRATDDAAERRMLRRRIAVNVGSEAALREIFGLDSEPLADFYGECDSLTPSTEDTIASFLQRYGQSLPEEAAVAPDVAAALTETTAVGSPAAACEEPAVSDAPELPVAPEIDYMAMLEASADIPSGEHAADDATSSAIDAFLSSNPAPERRRRSAAPAESAPEAMPSTAYDPSATPKSAAEAPETALPPERLDLSEGLARIMIKNGNYQKALEIITELNLKNPEKSIYFADQIRFLRKLMVNANKKR